MRRSVRVDQEEENKPVPANPLSGLLAFQQRLQAGKDKESNSGTIQLESKFNLNRLNRSAQDTAIDITHANDQSQDILQKTKKSRSSSESNSSDYHSKSKSGIQSDGSSRFSNGDKSDAKSSFSTIKKKVKRKKRKTIG